MKHFVDFLRGRRALATIGMILSMVALNALAQPKPALVRDTDNPAFQPIVLKAEVDFGGGGGSEAHAVNTNGTAFTVPQGKRLVVEYLSAGLVLPSTSRGAYFGLLTNDGVLAVTVPFVFVGSIPTVGDWYLGGQQVRGYVDAGAPVRIGCAKTSLDGTLKCDVAIVGYLVNLP